jgi:2-methylcitrate dehydratase PrpD
MGGEAKLIMGLTTGRCAKVASMVDQPEGSCAVSEITARIADFVLRRPEPLFLDGILRWASLQFLDTIGVTIAWGPMEAGRIARDAAVLLYGAGWHAARLLFDGRRVAGAAFAAATQTDDLDGHDGYSPTKGHIGVAVVPALTALAEAVSDLGGPEALAAIVIGYEIAGRAGIALHATVSDYHTSGAWNALGVVAMASRFIGLDDKKLRRSQMMREIATPTNAA